MQNYFKSHMISLKIDAGTPLFWDGILLGLFYLKY